MTTRTIGWLAAIAVLVAACGGSAGTVAPPAAPSAAPTPDDAARTRVLGDSILEAYGTDPRPAWYRYLRLTDGRPMVDVSWSTALVGVTPKISAALAAAMCRDIAVIHYDADAVDLGFTHVHIETAPNVSVADCTTP